MFDRATDSTNLPPGHNGLFDAMRRLAHCARRMGDCLNPGSCPTMQSLPDHRCSSQPLHEPGPHKSVVRCLVRDTDRFLQGLRWQFIGAFDAATEVAIVVLTIYQLWQLQMNMKNKSRVLIAFIFRLP
jgi:hypothetical protein